MSTIGLMGLLVAFAGVVVSVLCLAVGGLLGRKGESATGETLTWGGHIAVILTCVALTVCCGVLVYCFITGDYSIEYVLKQHSSAEGVLGTLYRLSGLWAGREGSLLFWAWLISVYNTVVAVRNLKSTKRLDAVALMVSQIVLAAFVAVLLFSEDNMPFTVTPDKYYNSNGTLTSAAKMLGMNSLLEHWAMAFHPPALFVGYAGLTIPFAYAIAALIINDPSREWVVRSQRYALFAWLFLGIGIGLGSVWAYVVLGWGGYWGWDAVENASLLSWLVGLALIHCFTVYRQRGAFKRWSVMCACITFAFVIVGTFISRSGIVQSVHAFEGDTVSLVLFGSLIAVAILAGIVGLLVRWKSFGPAADGSDDVQNIVSKEGAYYFNNVILVVFATLLAYLTISSALPSFLPFGGQTVSAGTFNAIARPLGIIYLAILACCPLLGWGKTLGSKFFKQARIPAICAAVLFVVLAAWWALYLVPGYDAIIAAGGTEAAELASEGPGFYYNGLALVGFLVASLLFFNSLFMLGRTIGAWKRSHECSGAAAVWGCLRNNAARFGGFLSHTAMAIILIGLIGSSMYVTEQVQYISYDEETDTSADTLQIRGYTLEYAGNSIDELEGGRDILYTVTFDAYKDGRYLGQVSPAVRLDQRTQQQKLVASVISLPTEDLFVVYRGVNDDNAFSMDVRVNPYVSFVWAGFVLLMVGILVATVGHRRASRKLGAAERMAADIAAGDAVDLREETASRRGEDTDAKADGKAGA